MMEALMRAAKATIIKKLNDLQLELDAKLDRPYITGPIEEMLALRNEILSLKNRLERI